MKTPGIFPGVFCLVEYQLWPLAFGLWPLAFGFWPLAFGFWLLATNVYIRSAFGIGFCLTKDLACDRGGVTFAEQDVSR